MDKEPRLDTLITRWLEEEAPSRLPERVLDNTFVRTRTTRQQVGWRSVLGKFRIHRFAPALGSVAVLVVGALALSYYASQSGLGGPAKPPALPVSPADWSRFAVDSRFATAQLDTFAAGPRGLLALVGELGSGAFQLAVSANGQEWSQVPSNQHPALEGHNVELAGTDRGFLMLVDSDVWTSADGITWERLAGSVVDPVLRQGDVLAVVAGGPGFVAVGSNNKAWHSTNGSDWSLGEVPPPPAELFERQGFRGQSVRMQGVAVAGDKLVAWGDAQADNGFETISVPVLWTSADGLSWASVRDLQVDFVMSVAGGTSGFVAIGADASDNGEPGYTAWFSVDGRVWQKGDAFTSLSDAGVPVTISVKSVAATPAGYVAVGANNQCLFGPCSLVEPDRPMEAVVWTSADGMSWSRLASSDLFNVQQPGDPQAARESDATSVAAWESQFVVGGQFDGKPVVWISGSNRQGDGASANSSPVAGEATPTARPTEEPTTPSPSASPVPIQGFVGNWEGTDPPPDGSNLTLDLVALSDGTFAVTIRDDFALVCDGGQSTMTGVAEATDADTYLIPEPDYVCDDGSKAEALSGPPLEDQLRNYTFTYDVIRDVLVGGGLEFTRSEALPAPTASPSTGCTNLNGGPYVKTLGTIGVTATMPSGWSGIGGDSFYLAKGTCLVDGALKIEVSLVSRTYGDACSWQGRGFDATAPADVVTALAAQEGHETIGPTDATLAGYPASRFEFSVPADFDASTCSDGTIRVWLSPQVTAFTTDPGRSVTAYVVDVDGTTLGVAASHWTVDETPALLAELDAVLATLQFELSP